MAKFIHYVDENGMNQISNIDLSTIALTGNYSDLLVQPTFAAITTKPSTLSGYGIVDAYPLSGNPNAYITASSPTLTTPILGVATATSINKVAITSPATSSTLTIANSGTLQLTGAFVLNLTATATTTPTFPTGTGVLAYLSGTNVWTGTNTMPLLNLITKGAPTSVNASATLTAAQVQSSIKTSSTIAVAFTMPTATLLATQVGATQGTTIEFTIDNSASTVSGAITLTLGTGMTSGLNAGLTILIGKAQRYIIYFTSTTTCVIGQIL